MKWERKKEKDSRLETWKICLTQFIALLSSNNQSFLRSPRHFSLTFDLSVRYILGSPINFDLNLKLFLRRGELETLKNPIRIKNLEVRNRVVMPPMVTRFASERGGVTR
jgi:hypothetical protein